MHDANESLVETKHKKEASLFKTLRPCTLGCFFWNSLVSLVFPWGLVSCSSLNMFHPFNSKTVFDVGFDFFAMLIQPGLASAVSNPVFSNSLPCVFWPTKTGRVAVHFWNAHKPDLKDCRISQEIVFERPTSMMNSKNLEFSSFKFWQMAKWICSYLTTMC